MREATARTGADHTRRSETAAIGSEIAPGDHGQDTGLAAHDFTLPSPPLAIAVDPPRQRIAIEQGTVGVIGVFDEQVVRAQRQGVDEAVGVVLPDIRIHHDRTGHRMRFGCSAATGP